MHFTIISSIQKDRKMSRVPREGRPQKRAKKNVSTQKAKKKKKKTLERVASVTRGSHVSRVFSPLSTFSLCHEKKTRQRKRRLLLRVYVQLRFYETCVYVIENKKRIERLCYFRRGKSQHKKYDLSVGVGLRLSRLRVSRPRERCALRRSVRR